MCEDRALRMKKESKARRIYQLRFRARMNRLAIIRPNIEQEQSPQQPEPSTTPASSSESSEPPLNSPFPSFLNIPEAKAFAAVLEQVEPGIYRYRRDAPCNLSPEVKARNEKLIEIALRTVILIRRNQQLQRKLAALQMETSTFITDVMNNPGYRQTPPAENEVYDVKTERLN